MNLKSLKLLIFYSFIGISSLLLAETDNSPRPSEDPDWERDAAAAGLTDQPRIPGTGQSNRDASEKGIPIMPPFRAGGDGSSFETDIDSDQIWDQREGIDAQLYDAEADAAEQQRFEEGLRFLNYQQQQIQEQEARTADRERTLTEAMRTTIDSSVDIYRTYMNADGKITSKESDYYDTLVEHQIDLWELTPADQAEIDAYGETRQEVADYLGNSADLMGGTDAASVQAREENRLYADAATKTWRSATATGTAVNMVGDDIYYQRELSIAAENKVIAATLYLTRTDLTADQRRAAESLMQQYQRAMDNADSAIVGDIGVIAVGVGFDVTTLFLGRAGGALSEARAGSRAATPASTTAAQSGTRAGASTAARTGPGSTQVLPRTGPGSTQVLPRTGPGSTQVLPRTGPGSTQVLPRTGPGSTQVLPRTGPGSTQVLPRTGPGSTQILPRTGTIPPVGTGASATSSAAAAAARNTRAGQDVLILVSQIGVSEVANRYWQNKKSEKAPANDQNDWSNATVVESRSSLAAVSSLSGQGPFAPIVVPPGAQTSPPTTPALPKPDSPTEASTPQVPVIPETPIKEQPVNPTTPMTPPAPSSPAPMPDPVLEAVLKQFIWGVKHGANSSDMCVAMDFLVASSMMNDLFGSILTIQHTDPGGATQEQTLLFSNRTQLLMKLRIYAYGLHLVRIMSLAMPNGQLWQLSGQTSQQINVNSSEPNKNLCQ